MGVDHGDHGDMTETELAVLTANDGFYDAFADRDEERMDALWARERQVTCIHPGWSVLVGRAAIMASWRAIFRGGGVRIEASAARAFVGGDTAYVVCHEAAAGEPPTLIATNVFVREAGVWRMAHHHAGGLAAGAAAAEAEAPSGPSN
jgi:hypothetical protein